MRKCAKCNGTGRLRKFSHWQEGRCFSCDGLGKIPVRAAKPKIDHIAIINEKLAKGWSNI